MDLVFVWLFVAFAIERIIEIITNAAPILNRIKIEHFNVKMILSFIFGIIISMGIGLNFFEMFNISFKINYLGEIISALFIMGGSNVIHDIVDWISANKNVAKANSKYIDEQAV